MNIWHRPKMVVLVALVLLCLVGGAALFYLAHVRRPDHSASAGFPNPWRPTTNPHDPSCKSGCVEQGTYRMSHGPTVQSLVRPGTDDAVAQWGDCLQSVDDCLNKEGRDNLSKCVAASVCPQSCKDLFSRRAGNEHDRKRLFDTFEDIFIAPDAACAPREKEVTP